jgi:phosphatidylserine/phosphatidylglycerophosphate/cardiolipin synthase-like enzyme
MLAASLSAVTLVVAPVDVRGQDTLYFTALQDARQPILNLIAAEQIRIDIGAWWFTDRVVSDALVRRHRAGVRVRFLGDAHAYRNAHTKAEIDFLASAGIPIRLRAPADAAGILHWKCGIFAGQNKVAFGSANWTVYSLRPYSATNYDDETLLVTADSDLVPAFKMKFDQMWVDTTAFADFANITSGVRARFEPDVVTPRALVWGQGTEYNSRLIAEIEAEQQSLDFVLYRLDAVSVTDALARRVQAGVSVRLVIDPVQYRNSLYPRASANLDRLWSLSVPIKQRQHQGLTHMKTIITSTIATKRIFQRDGRLAAGSQLFH